MAKLTKEKLKELLEQGQHLYVICVSSIYIRDAQYHDVPYSDDADDYDQDEDDDEEENWVDYEPSDFLGTIMAANRSEAVHKMAKECNYNPQHLEAYDVLDDDE